MRDRIESVTPYLVPADLRPHGWWSHKPYLLVRVETGDGIVGWGECHMLNFRERTLVEAVHAIGDWFHDRSAANIRDLPGTVWNAFGQQRPGPEVHSAAAGLEIALWDILGKRLDTPVYRLLGGACHESLAVYANIYSPNPQTPDAFADMAMAQVAAGHRAIKLYPFGANTPVRDGIAILSAVRDAVGPDIGLAVDLWRHATPHRAIELGRAMERFDLLWLEDPLPPDDAETLRRIRDAIPQPLMSGETLATRRDFTAMFAARAVDMVNPDICQTGILELQAIASSAEPFNITISPHNSNTMAVGTAAALHAGLTIPNLGPVEYFPLFEAAMDTLCSGRPGVEQGRLGLPQGAGLGMTFDDGAMARYRIPPPTAGRSTPLR